MIQIFKMKCEYGHVPFLGKSTPEFPYMKAGDMGAAVRR